MPNKDEVIKQQSEEIQKLQKQLKTATRPSTLVSVFKANAKQGIHHFFHREAKMKDMEKENKKLKKALESKEEELNRTNAELVAASVFQSEENHAEGAPEPWPEQPQEAAFSHPDLPQTADAAIQAYFKGIDLKSLSKELYPQASIAKEAEKEQKIAAPEMEPDSKVDIQDEAGQKVDIDADIQDKPGQEVDIGVYIQNKPEQKVNIDAQEERVTADIHASGNSEKELPPEPKPAAEDLAETSSPDTLPVPAPDNPPAKLTPSGSDTAKRNSPEKQESDSDAPRLPEPPQAEPASSPGPAAPEKQENTQAKQPAVTPGAAKQPSRKAPQKAERKKQAKTDAEAGTKADEKQAAEAASAVSASSQMVQNGQSQETPQAGKPKAEVPVQGQVPEKAPQEGQERANKKPPKQPAKVQEQASAGPAKTSEHTKDDSPMTEQPETEQANRVSILGKNGERINRKDGRKTKKAEPEPAPVSPREELPDSFGIVLDDSDQQSEFSDMPTIGSGSVFGTDDWDDANID